MKSLALVPLFLLGLSAPVLADDEGFVPLFNGKDLSGWHPVNVAADTFCVRDGMLVTTGIPIGVMASARMYENFIIELDWQHMTEGGNSGLYIWGEPMPAPGVPFSKGIEVQILDLGYERQHPDGANKWFTSQGDIFPIWGATMTPTGRIAGKRSFPTENRTKPSPEWNHYRVECNKGEIRLSINGKETTVGKDCVPRKGFICLESEGAECHFKNIRIKELPSSNTPPEQTANDYAGFHQLFDGKGLAGWKVTDEVKPFWSAEGAKFIGKADPEGLHKDLWTEKEYGDFELIADWRLPNKPQKKALNVILPDGTDALNADGGKKTEEVMDAGDSGIHLRGNDKAHINITCKSIGSGEVYGFRVNKKLDQAIRAACVPKTKADLKPGQWNRFHITMKGDRLTVKLNGVLVIDNAQLPGIAASGPIGLQHHGEGIEFANIFIKQL